MNSKRIAAIVLAAGGATRFGAPKQIALFRGEPLVRRTARHAHEAGASPIVVVAGAYSTAVSQALDGLSYATVVVNGNWQSGIASSLRTGIATVASVTSHPVDAVLLLTIDQPLVDAAMLSNLIDAFGTEQSVIAAEYGSVIGVPALIGRQHLDDLARTVAGDRGAAGWLRAHEQLVTRIPFEPAAFDADTLHALRAIEQLRR